MTSRIQNHFIKNIKVDLPEYHGDSAMLDQMGRRHQMKSRDRENKALQAKAREMSIQIWMGLTRTDKCITPQKMNRFERPSPKKHVKRLFLF